MRFKFFTIILSLWIAAIAFTSCLHGHDNDEIVYPSNTSITAVTMGNLVSTYTKYIDGKDTIVTDTIAGAKYLFSIDQLNHVIENVDSLPYHTDISKVPLEITADTDYILYTKAGKDSVWASTDSLDFTQPIEFKVVAFDMSVGLPYTIRINVHQVDPEALAWTSMNTNFMGTKITRQKAVTFNERIYVFAEQEDQVELTSTSASDGSDWADLTPLDIPEKADYSTAMSWNDTMYIVANGKLYQTTDGNSWEEVQNVPALSMLVANYEVASGKRLVAINKEGTTFVETEDGVNWIETGTVPSNFPQKDLSFTSYSLPSNENLERMIVVGQNDNKPYNISWSRLSTEKTWGDNGPTKFAYACPNLDMLSIVHFGEQLYAFGGNGVLNDSNISAFQYFYESADQGIHWKAVKEDVIFPSEFATLYNQADGNFSYTVDENNYLWIMWSNSSNVWRGRINKLAK